MRYFKNNLVYKFKLRIIMKKFLLLSVVVTICSLMSACSDELPILESEVNSSDLLSANYSTSLSKSCGLDSIISLEGDSIAMRKLCAKTRSASSYSDLYEELHQLDQIPIYLQIIGNNSTKHFLDVSGEGKELTFEDYKDNNVSQQFYIKILPASTGIPYLIYSKKTNTPISLGAYSSNPDVKVVYAKPSSNTSTFGASWDIRYGEYSKGSFIIENQDYPQQGNSGSIYDIYYSVN